MPEPIGPRPMSTRTSPGLIGSSPCPLIAAIASRSVVKTRAGPSLAIDAVGVDDAGSMAVLLMTEPSGARLPRGKETVLVRPRVARLVPAT